MQLAAFTATCIVALFIYVDQATTTCTRPCTTCTTTCGPLEVPTPAGTRAQDHFCKPSVTCQNEVNRLRVCVCKPGYVRNAWGHCIRKEDCCSCRRAANMDFNPCSSSCPKTCGVPENKDCSRLCVRGCACAPGYWRAYPHGPCVAPNQCPSGAPLPSPITCPGPHQVYTACSSPCPITCANLNNPPTSCPAACGNQHCVCAPGYVALQLNPLTCVRIDECPGRERRCPGRNQKYTTCKSRCPATCAINRTRICLAECAGEGCVCRQGFVILQENPLICVRRKDCPAMGTPNKCPGPGEVFTTCKSRCPPTCWDSEPRNCTADCAGEGCVCREGFVQLQDRPLVCVRRDKCPAPPVTCSGAHQVYTPCKSRCPATCLNGGRSVCSNECAGQGCACRKGYFQLQAEPLVCVTEEVCAIMSQKQCSEENQVFTSCKSACPATCADHGVPRVCGNHCAGQGCVCKEGFVMLQEVPLKCVRRDQCTVVPQQCADENQEFTTCKSRCPETCNEPGPRSCTRDCAGEGCVCKRGFVQLHEHPLICVRRDKCPARPEQCAGANQVYTSCKSSCPETCTEVGPRVCTANCVGQGCVCKEGYVELQANPLICVLREQCPSKPQQCVGANQVYTPCKSRCPRTCSDSGPRVCTRDCAGEGCVCKEGYIQLQENPLICVRSEQCPARPKQCTGANQVYTTCKSRCPATCTDSGPRACGDGCAGQGCVCKKGYFQLQAKPLICVSHEICDAMAEQWCPGENQVYTSCKSSCPATCSGEESGLCPNKCAGKGCVCKKGFVQLQAEPLVCVRRDNCPANPKYCAGANQVYSPCKSQCPATCSDYGPRECDRECAGKGCVCKEGFVELQQRPLICVRRDQCPARPERCPGPNQVFTLCKSKCPENCSDKGPRVCSADCAGQGCVCRQGYVQLKAEPLVCVRRAECPEKPKQCKRANQEYTSCRPGCPATCSGKGPNTCSTECDGEGCACKKGFLQLQRRPLICVTEEICAVMAQQWCPGEHQVYTPCKSLCPETCSDDDTPECADECGGQGCVCEEGYVQLQAQPLICVRRKECPARQKKCKRANQVYTTCRSRCPPTCSDKVPQACGADCAGDGCVCKPGYFRLQKKPLLCVTEETCDSSYQVCNGTNQMFSLCKSLCPETCSDDGPRYCSSKCGGHGCVCKDGYVQLKAEPLTCVRREQCPFKPKVCPVSNQVYTTCKSRCPATCTNKEPGACTYECAGEGCVCKRGYVMLRETPLHCVRATECPATPERCPGVNQVYSNCKSPCPLTCWDSKARACPATCAGVGCECKKGTVMLREKPLTCVKPRQCFDIANAANPELIATMSEAITNSSVGPGGLLFPEGHERPTQPNLPTTTASVGPGGMAFPGEPAEQAPPPALPPLPTLPTPRPSEVPGAPEGPTVPATPTLPSRPSHPEGPAMLPSIPPSAPVRPEAPAVQSQPTVPTSSMQPSVPAYATPMAPAQPGYTSVGGFPVIRPSGMPGAPVYPGATMIPGHAGFPVVATPMVPGATDEEPAVKALSKPHY
ncbi:zonadhesin-like [Dermacentor andersoni]|uniref:zonadhesin-like n=1 Tax=Dermacentor andersoni TaxID=34620 RepID=UPI0021553642